MSKNKIIKLICAAILILLIIACIGFYIADIVINDSAPTENLFKALAVIFICCGSLIRIFYQKGRRNLAFYDSQYREFTSIAFIDAPAHKKKLLRALRLYNEDNFEKSLNLLSSLKPVCKSRDDLYTVGLFTALVLTDMRLEDDAIIIYNALINMNITSSTIYGNLGSLYSSKGSYDEAISNLHLAIQNDESNPAPYSNLAKLYFDKHDFDIAERYALKALDVNFKFRQAASLLAIIYSLEGDTDRAEKYTHIAITNGENPNKLKNAIEYYREEKYTDKHLSDSEDEDCEGDE